MNEDEVFLICQIDNDFKISILVQTIFTDQVFACQFLDTMKKVRPEVFKNAEVIGYIPTP